MAHLRSLDSEHRFHIDATPFTVGTSRSCQLELHGERVKPVHFHIICEGYGFRLQPLKQAGVWVNGKATTGQMLEHGDRIQAGNRVLEFSLLETSTSVVDDTTPTPSELEAYKRLYRFSYRHLEDTSLPVLLRNLVDDLLDETRADKGFIFLYEGRKFRCRTARDSQGRNLVNPLEEVSKSVLRKVVKTGKPLFVNDVLSDPELSAISSVARLNIVHIMCVPLHDGEETIGLVYVAKEDVERQFSRSHLELLSIFSMQASLIIRKAMQTQERARRHRSLIELSPDAVLVFTDGQCSFVNPAGVELLAAASAEAVIGRHISDFSVEAPADSRPLPVLLQLIIDREPFQSVELKIRRVDGSILDVEASGALFVSGSRESVQLIIRDVTERKKMTANMMQMDRMIAVGTLAAGVAHEINNPLAYVLANVEYSARCVAELDQGKGSVHPKLVRQIVEALDDSIEGIHRVDSIVQGLKTFSRSSRQKSVPIDVEEVLESSIKMAWNEIRHRAQLERDYSSVPDIKGCESRLGQVFLNLLINAVQAIPEGAVDSNKITVGIRPRGDRVVVEIADTGKGISPECIDQIFDPFFTTKFETGGTGLGLSICRNIIETLGAAIEVDSTPGEGTTFRMEFPLAGSGIEQLASSSSVVDDDNSLSVLVIDDEPSIGRSVQRLMKPQWDVVWVTDARMAINFLNEGKKFDLILCDLLMPEMSGMDFFVQLEASRPQLCSRVVFMTGGAFTERALEFLDSVENSCIDKPFSPNALSKLATPDYL